MNITKLLPRLFLPLVVILAASGSLRAAEGSGKLSPLELARQLNQAFIDVADRVSPAVVVIRVAHKASHMDAEGEENPYLDLLPPQFRQQLEEHREQQRREREKNRRPGRRPMFDGQGSGVVIRKEGYILTNRHVVDGAERIKVLFKDGSEFDGEVRGVDAQSDVAVVKINPGKKTLAVVSLADSDKTRVGEFAIAIGAPFELDYSVTFGHVSAKGRTGIVQDGTMDQDFLQTDASINPGNSGGPLVNIEGEVIGINTLIRGMQTGIGFAIPSNLAREIAERLIADGKFVRAYLGVRIEPLKGDTEYRDLITGVKDGVVVTAIPPGGPAARSDLKPGDVIVLVEGRPVSTAQQLKNEIRGKKIGSTVTLDVHRFGRNIKVKVKLDAWPDDSEPVLAKRREPEDDKTGSFGLTVQTVTKDLAEQFGVEKGDGVIVTEVERDSVAALKGIRPGDIITELNGKPVTTLKEYRQYLKEADAKRGVVVIYSSRGTSKVEVLREDGE